MTSFCNDVTDWLMTGGDLSLAQDLTGRSAEAVARELIGRGVTHVLDVRSEWTDAKVWRNIDPSVRYCHAPIIDQWGHLPDESWYLAVEDFVKEFLEATTTNEAAKLYVHCHMGINRGTSAAMLALLTNDPGLDPYDAFLMIREVRPAAGLVYAEEVGRRHLRKAGADDEELESFSAALRDYWQWDPDRIPSVNRHIAYYRSKEGGTIKVGGTPVLACPIGLEHPEQEHRVKWNSGNPVCLDCDSLAVVVGE